MPSADVRFAAVVAVTQEWGIGAADGAFLPWHPRRLHLDMQFLRAVTTNGYDTSEGAVALRSAPPADGSMNAVIMGRRTWESIPAKFKPMPGRINVVVTSAPESVSDGQSVLGAASFEDALSAAQGACGPHGQVFVLGGARLYAEAIADARCAVLFLTRLVAHPPMPCGVFFPRDAYAAGAWTVQDMTAACHAALKPSASVVLVDGRAEQPADGIAYVIEAHVRAISTET